MASRTQYQKEYEKASLAYMQGDYNQAAKLTHELVRVSPSDPMYRLLYAHINLALERYQDSIGEYETVLQLTDDNSILEYAHSGIAAAKERLDFNDEIYNDPGDEAGSPGPRHRHHPQELRSPGQEGQAQAGQVRAAHEPAQYHSEL